MGERNQRCEENDGCAFSFVNITPMCSYCHFDWAKQKSAPRFEWQSISVRDAVLLVIQLEFVEQTEEWPGPDRVIFDTPASFRTREKL
jgi:hypothetical protein